MTFDIEEWFHLLDNESTKHTSSWHSFECRIHKNMDVIFELLQETNNSATFFILGWIAEKYPDIVKRIDEMGFQIGSHSYSHQLVYEQNRQEFREDLKKSLYLIEELIGKKVTLYRAPGFSITKNNLWAFEELIENGIKIDASIFPASRAHGGINDFTYMEPCRIKINGFEIKEFPINTISIAKLRFVFSGGGYFRLFPYKVLKIFWKKSPYVITYFHPRDFDFNQPMIKDISLLRKFKSYYGLKGSISKLRKILDLFSFMDIRTADSNINWESTPIQVIKQQYPS